jgi:hypothetical protein
MFYACTYQQQPVGTRKRMVMSPSFVRQRVAMTTVAATLSILLLLEITQAAEAATGCRGAEMCCRQKDNKCRVPGQRMNRKGHVHGVNQTCFCDAGCLELGDCCVDYRHYCEGDLRLVFKHIIIQKMA